ncbi:MAG: hypothetical protein ACRDTD_25525, partial [Pseudonocardiaceae bacterium]
MNEAADASTEARYLRGDLGFEDALREVTGNDVGRQFFAQILHGLSDRNPAAPPLSDHDAALLDQAGFV